MMNWTFNDVTPQNKGESWLAGAQAWFRRSTAAPLAWDNLHLQTDYFSASGNLYINVDPWYIGIEESAKRVTLSRYIGGNLMAAWDLFLKMDNWNSVVVGASCTSLSITINDQTFHYESSAPTPLTSVALYFSEGALFREPELTVHEIATPAAPGLSSTPPPKTLDFTVDFHDDLQLTPFNQKMVDDMFGLMAELGTSRVYWIHHGERGNGFWEGGPAAANMESAFELLGNDYLPPAVEAAHKASLPLIGIFKPFDTAILHYTSPLSSHKGSAQAVGGRVDQGFAFPAAHSELCMQRRTQSAPQASPSQIVIRSRQRLTAESGQPVELFVSGDNENYSLYQGPVKIEITDNEIIVSEFEIEETFVALSFSPDLAAQIQNTLPQLVEISDAAGGLLDFTYGITSRVSWQGEYHLAGNLKDLNFQTHGLNFDCAGHSVPNAVWNSQKRMLELFSPANSGGIIGLALAVNPNVPGVLSESEPETHHWWLSNIENMLDAGVDGVEIRTMNHSNIIDWSLYGFNSPLVEEYERRYGIDITRNEFSREKFRALRGEFFTDFLRKASDLVRKHGKKFYLHIEDTHQGPADEPCPMEIAMPWRQWIEEGICDGVTLKVLNVRANDTAFGREVIAACRARQIPVSFSSFIHSVFNAPERDDILDSYLASEYDAFNVYEFATLFEFTPQGEVKVVEAPMLSWLKNCSWEKSNL